MVADWQGALLLLLLGAVVYLIYRVDRLEKVMSGRARTRRTTIQTGGGRSKVIPILKPEIEPGPFAKGNSRQETERDDNA